MDNDATQALAVERGVMENTGTIYLGGLAEFSDGAILTRDDVSAYPAEVIIGEAIEARRIVDEPFYRETVEALNIAPSATTVDLAILNSRYGIDVK